MWRSLRFRLLLATILVVFIAVGVTAFVATRRTTGEFRRYVERRDPMTDRRLAFFLARTYDRTGSWDGIQSEIVQLAQMSGQRVVVADANRKIVADSEDKLIGKTRRREVASPFGRARLRRDARGRALSRPDVRRGESGRRVPGGGQPFGPGWRADRRPGRRGRHAGVVEPHPPPGRTPHRGRPTHGKGRSHGSRARSRPRTKSDSWPTRSTRWPAAWRSRSSCAATWSPTSHTSCARR